MCKLCMEVAQEKCELNELVGLFQAYQYLCRRNKGATNAKTWATNSLASAPIGKPSTGNEGREEFSGISYYHICAIDHKQQINLFSICYICYGMQEFL